VTPQIEPLQAWRG